MGRAAQLYDFAAAPVGGGGMLRQSCGGGGSAGSGAAASPLDRYIAQSYGRADAHLTHNELLAVMHDLQQRLARMHRAQREQMEATAEPDMERFQKPFCRKCCY